MLSEPSGRGREAPATRTPESFGRNRRILRRADYLETYSSGRRFVGRWLVFFVKPCHGPRARLGVTITKKSGGAVVRNRLRRKLRELFRRGTGLRTALDVVVNVRPGAEKAEFTELSRDFEKLVSRVGAGGIVTGIVDERPGLGARGAAGLLALYKRFLSPLLPPACRFQPTCSEYARESILRHGLFRGAWLSVLRLSRCHPFHPGGFDPVP